MKKQKIDFGAAEKEVTVSQWATEPPAHNLRTRTIDLSRETRLGELAIHADDDNKMGKGYKRWKK